MCSVVVQVLVQLFMFASNISWLYEACRFTPRSCPLRVVREKQQWDRHNAAYKLTQVYKPTLTNCTKDGSYLQISSLLSAFKN